MVRVEALGELCGKQVIVGNDQILDWMITEDANTIYGGYTYRCLAECAAFEDGNFWD